MCVIAYVPAGKTLEEDVARRMFKANDDGAGFGWLTNERGWKVIKAMEFQELWDAYMGTQPLYNNTDFLFHFRIATHGEVNLDNAHPFVVDENTIMAHNGIISCVPNYKDGRSDTRVFVEETLPKLPEGWLDIPHLRWMVESAVSSSKMVFLTNDPALSVNAYILNEKAGDWLDSGIWVSNKHWQYTAVSTIKRGGFHTVSSRHLTSDEYWEAQMGGEGYYPLAKAAPTPKETTTTFDQKDRLEDLRMENWGLGSLISYNHSNGKWLCWGCDEEIDLDNASCECFDKICEDCLSLAGDCECVQGYPRDTRWIGELDVEDLEAIVELKPAMKGALDKAIANTLEDMFTD